MYYTRGERYVPYPHETQFNSLTGYTEEWDPNFGMWVLTEESARRKYNKQYLRSISYDLYLLLIREVDKIYWLRRSIWNLLNDKLEKEILEEFSSTAADGFGLLNHYLIFSKIFVAVYENHDRVTAIVLYHKYLIDKLIYRSCNPDWFCKLLEYK